MTTTSQQAPITIACLDMAATTVADDGGVLAAFAAAIGRCGLAGGTPAHDQAMKTAQVTMGQSKIEVFRQIFTDEADAQRANAAFEECYAAAVAAGGVEATSLIAAQAAVAPFDSQYRFRLPWTLMNQTNAPTIGSNIQRPVQPGSGAGRPSQSSAVSPRCWRCWTSRTCVRWMGRRRKPRRFGPRFSTRSSTRSGGAAGGLAG